MTSLSLFVSHASADADLARSIVELAERATKLPARSIRCTSVDGYRLEAGARTDDTLRREIKESAAFVALLTPMSLASAYVLFELGARWASEKPLVPLLARGVTAAALRGPVAHLNAINLLEKAQIFHFVEGLAGLLSVSLEPSSSFAHTIDAVVAAAAKGASSPKASTDADLSPPNPNNHARERAIRKMRACILARNGGEFIFRLAEAAGISQEEAQHYLKDEEDVVFEKGKEGTSLLSARFVKLP